MKKWQYMQMVCEQKAQSKLWRAKYLPSIILISFVITGILLLIRKL